MFVHLVAFNVQNWLGSAKRSARADSRPGHRTKINAMSKEDFSEKKLKWPE